ncbi:hypothetical protein CDN99_07390 [Roseateles aquatilis]|uniref:Type 4 fimbrial biogenesis protein PilX N-terminal domain-containing protein n=2 Tax=Roseateles aquatilis TaxID=431061 RepID=A0A246JI09_9BURK|nr:hypothetical protein CDN99_07390 [Roseateles aquatilis]
MCAILLAILALGAAWAARQLSTAQRVAANDLRAAMAAEAAESGLAWALAMLNTGRIDDQCRPAFGPAGSVPEAGSSTTSNDAADANVDARTNTSTAGRADRPGSAAMDFRNRFLQVAQDGHYRVLTTGGTSAATSAPEGSPGTGGGTAEASSTWQAACANTGALRWACRCQPGALPGPAVDPSAAPAQAQPLFTVRLTDTATPGQLRLLVRGCSDRAPDCDRGDDGPIGVAEVSQHLALLSALRLPPPTALVEGPGAFMRTFGYPPARYRSQPAITRLRCTSDCRQALATALARGRRLLWIDGDARLSDLPVEAVDGSPLVLIVDGRLDLAVSTPLLGVLYARDGVSWHPPAGAPASIRGAIVTDGILDRGRSVELIHDPALLRGISRRMGSFLPVPGGWTPTR